ncbi:hypothetical protein HZS_5405 [Henneguya salminicola]|nr:hypothetical protein HZS_5405 [Henneguya salminicola]
MAPNLLFNGRSYIKNLTKTNVTYYKCSNCDRGCPFRLIFRNNEISENYQRTAVFNRNEFDRSSMSHPLSLLPNNQPFFRRYWVGDIHGVQHKMMIWVTNPSLSLLRYNGPTFVYRTLRTPPPNPFYKF